LHGNQSHQGRKSEYYGREASRSARAAAASAQQRRAVRRNETFAHAFQAVLQSRIST
jgi:hypothetical protein